VWRTNCIDRITQFWVRVSGRKIKLSDASWLQGPIGNSSVIADDWLGEEAERRGAVLAEGMGLLPDMAQLQATDFDPSQLAAEVVSFYQDTAEWSMEVSHEWSRAALPAGWVLSRLFTNRLQQLNFPLGSAKVANRITSRVVSLVSEDGDPIGVAWMRTLPATGQYVYSGWYGTATLPGSVRPCLRVVFPLPNGSLMVFLRPEARSDGALILESPKGKFGEPGAYLVVAPPDEGFLWARRIPIYERFVVGVSDGGDLYTDHDLRIWNIPVIRFNYRLKHRSKRPIDRE